MNKPVIGAAAAALVLAAALAKQVLPDVQRYLRLRRM